MPSNGSLSGLVNEPGNNFSKNLGNRLLNKLGNLAIGLKTSNPIKQQTIKQQTIKQQTIKQQTIKQQNY